jgi:2'-5' RNA ligase
MRLFIALDISDELRESLEQLRPQLLPFTSMRLVDPENTHLTLKYLGEVPEEKLPKVIEALKELPFEPVRIQTTKLGTFPKVLWLGVKLNKELAQLHQHIQRAVKPWAMYDPRPYKPHLTLARFPHLPKDQHFKLQRLLKKRIEKKWKAEEFILYSSELTPHGPIYKRQAVFLPGDYE